MYIRYKYVPHELGTIYVWKYNKRGMKWLHVVYYKHYNCVSNILPNHTLAFVWVQGTCICHGLSHTYTYFITQDMM